MSSGPASFVSSSAVFEGLTWRTPASFVIGIEIAEALELNSPIRAIALSSPATLRALAEVAPASHWPACAVESSSFSYVTVHEPALAFRCSRASVAPFWTSSEFSRVAPCSGRLE